MDRVFSPYNDSNSIIFEPPKKITTMYYRCSKKFIIDKIVDMYLDEYKYGIVLISGSGYMFFNLIKTGSHIEIVNLLKDTIKLQKRQKKGGQSAQRIGRCREEKEHNYVKKVSEKMINTYITDNIINVRGIIVAGPAEMKKKVVEYSETKKFLGSKILKIVDTVEIDENVIWSIYEKCLNELATDSEKESIKLIEEIKKLMLGANDKVVFGPEVFDNLKMCSLEKVLISSDIPLEQKEAIYKLGKYGCEIIEASPANIKSIGIDIIGIKYY